MFFSSGSYTVPAGVSQIVHRISEFITRRDGGIPSHPENIFISPGSQWALGVRVSALHVRKMSFPSSSSWHDLFLCLLEHPQRVGEQWGFPQIWCAGSSAMLPPYPHVHNWAGSSHHALPPQWGAGLGRAGGGAAASTGICKGTL